MALKVLRDFDTVNRSFEPLDNADTSDEHVSFDSITVERVFLNSKRIIDDFENDLERFINKISSITTTGIKGSSIAIAVDNYKGKMRSGMNRIKNAKSNYNRVMLNKINDISYAEVMSGRQINEGQNQIKLEDPVSLKAQSMINYAQDSSLNTWSKKEK